MGTSTIRSESRRPNSRCGVTRTVTYRSPGRDLAGPGSPGGRPARPAGAAPAAAGEHPEQVPEAADVRVPLPEGEPLDSDTPSTGSAGSGEPAPTAEAVPGRGHLPDLVVLRSLLLVA